MSSPFKFLDAYTKEDARIFFGRQLEVDELYQMVFRSNLVLIYGESGTGKTSVVQCGLANRFQDEDWFALYTRRQNNINESFDKKLEESAVTEFAQNGDAKLSVPKKIRSLYLDYFKPIYLIFDQFEELFILGSEEEQNEFAENLRLILDSDVPTTIILVIREEYLGHLYNFERTFPNLFDQRLRIEPMTRPKIKMVLENSFDQFNISVDQPAEESYQQIIHNISSGKSGIQLPYLQVYLDELYREDFERTYSREREGNELPELEFTQLEIEEFGRIDDVLERYLNKQIVNLRSKFEQNFTEVPADTVNRILDAFITEEGTKRPLHFTILPNNRWSISADEDLLLDDIDAAPLSECLKYLEQARLVRLTESNIELAHDSLGSIIYQRRSATLRRRIELRRRLRHAYQEYTETGQFLNLQQVTAFEEALDELKAPPEQHEFVAASREQIEEQQRAQVAEAERQAAIERRRRQFAVGLSTIALIGFVFASLQFRAADKAKGQAIEMEQMATQRLNDFLEEQERRMALEQEQVEDLFTEANSYIQAGFYGNAEAIFPIIIALDSSQTTVDRVEQLKSRIPQ